MIRRGKQGKRKVVEGNDVAAFIGVLFDLFSYNHYKKEIEPSKAPQSHIQIFIL